MAYVRLWQSGFEMGGNEVTVPATYGSTAPVVSTTKARTGTRSLRFGITSQSAGKAFSAVATARAGFYFNHLGASSATGLCILCYFTTSGNDILLLWDEANDKFYLREASTADLAETTPAAAGVDGTDVWYHVGIYYDGGASGTVSVYIDGVEVLTYDGTLPATVNGFYVGGIGGGAVSWVNFMYIDDIYVDSAIGESDAPPSSYRFLWGVVDSAGAATNLSVTGAANNYQAVDDATPDGDTSYVYAESASVKDSYGCAAITVPAGYAVTAVIPTAAVRKTDAGTASQWGIGVRAAGGTEDIGSAQDLQTAYTTIFDRQEAVPGGGSWDETAVNGAQIILESAGSF